jgi:hypothetical protein
MIAIHAFPSLCVSCFSPAHAQMPGAKLRTGTKRLALMKGGYGGSGPPLPISRDAVIAGKSQMSRYPLLLLIVLSLLSSTTANTQSVAPDSSGAFYKLWIGKFPSDRVAGKTFLEHPDVQRRIKQTLGPDALPEMKEMRASFPAQEYQNWLLVSGCQPHLCVDAKWTIAINLVTDETWACLAPLSADFVQFGASDKKPIRVPRKEGQICPEGENVAEQFSRLSPAELR